MSNLRKTFLPALSLLTLFSFQIYSAEPESPPHGLAPYFTPATASPKSPDKDGFLQRWLLLEPINKPNRSNTIFTDSYIRDTFKTLQNGYAANLPHDGDKVTIADQE